MTDGKVIVEIAVPMEDSLKHLGGCVLQGDARCWVPEVWSFLVGRYSPRRVIDVGCGGGQALAWFRTKGIHTDGVDGWANALIETSKLCDLNRDPWQGGGGLCLWDYATGPFPTGNPLMGSADLIAPRWDLAWCCEFVEHVEEQFIPNFMATLQRCDVIAMTHAVPGQDGHHHVNCREEGYWIDLFRDNGFDLEVEATGMARKIAPAGTYPRDTLLIFRWSGRYDPTRGKP